MNISAIAAAAGSTTTASYSFASDANTGMYRVGADQAALIAGGYAALEFRKSTGNFANIGMGGNASVSDSYPLLIQRSNTSVGTYLQISNPDTSASSKATFQLSCDNGLNTGEISLFTAATTTAAYADSLVIRPADGTARLSLIGGDEATGHVTFYTGGNYTSAGEAIRVNADKSIQFMQQIATPATPASGSFKIYVKSDDALYVLNDSGTESAVRTGTVAIANGGTGQTSASAAFDALASGVRPAFYATRGSTQSINSGGGGTKVQFATEGFDTNSNYDNATNYRFTPTVAGKYLIMTAIEFAAMVDTAVATVEIYKNGSNYAGSTGHAATTKAIGPSVTALVDMNGSTDYVEVFAYQDTGSAQNISGSGNRNFFMGMRLA